MSELLAHFYLLNLCVFIILSVVCFAANIVGTLAQLFFCPSNVLSVISENLLINYFGRANTLSVEGKSFVSNVCALNVQQKENENLSN